MKFTKGAYPQLKGHPEFDHPCWELSGRWVWADADWNPRFPFGTSACVHLGRARGEEYQRSGPQFTLDVNPPLGEPNRLYLWLGRWSVTLGLPSLRTSRPTGELARGWPVYRAGLGWPHIDGLDRYRYHRDAAGRWARNPRPEPWHWGWLTIERRENGRSAAKGDRARGREARQVPVP